MEAVAMPILKRALRGAAVLCAAISFAAATAPAFAQEDLPGRVGRVADVGGELFIAPQERPEAWTAAAVNYPVAAGDNLWAGRDARAEIDLGGTQMRLAGDTNLHVSRLDDREFALFVAQGRVSIRVRVLEGGEVARIDTPNAQVAITRPGLYRVDVTPDREHTYLIVREGEANVQTATSVQQVLPGQSAAVDGPNPQYSTVQNGAGLDGFDAWVADRDRYYRTAVSSTSSYVSPQMVGAADLAQYGTWSQNSEYGAVWYPNDVPNDWAPYRNGYWVDVGAWGPTWVDYAPWGYAPFHYGRWAFIGGRWGWTPGVYVARPVWAPALVAWTGGAGWSVAVRTGGPVYGWVPLAWGEPYRPWWGRCSYGCWERYNRPYAVNVNVWRPNSPPPTQYRNWNAPNGVTAVQASSLYARQPVQQNMVRVSREQVATAPVLSSAPQVRADPNRAAFQRPANAPPPASAFQPSYARPSSAPGSGTNMTRESAPPVQSFTSPSSGNVSPSTRTPTQAQPAMQRDDSRRSPSYSQPQPASPAQSYAPPQGSSSTRVQPQSPQMQTPQREAQSPSQGQMTRSPQPVPGQAYPQSPSAPPSRVQSQPQPQPQMQQQPARGQPQAQPQVQPQPARVQPQSSPPPQAAPQAREQRGAPPAQAQPAPQSRPAPDASGNAQRGGESKPRDAPQGQDSGGSGNMQRQSR
ncbi:MAG: DUF6600 domain-containing protein [Burkholderiales bacterium]